jgi:hypothetical protein
LLVYLWFVYKTAFSKPIISLFCLYFAWFLLLCQKCRQFFFYRGHILKICPKNCQKKKHQWSEGCATCVSSGQETSPPPPNIGNKVLEMVSYST